MEWEILPEAKPRRWRPPLIEPGEPDCGLKSLDLILLWLVATSKEGTEGHFDVMEKGWSCNFFVERHSYKVAAQMHFLNFFSSALRWIWSLYSYTPILLYSYLSVSGQFAGAFRRSKPAQERPKRTQEHPRNSSLLSRTPQEPTRLALSLIAPTQLLRTSNPHQKPPPSLQSSTRANPNLPRNFLEGGSPAGVPPARHVEHRYRVRRGGSARSHGDDGTPGSTHAPDAPPSRQSLRPRALH